MSIPDWATTISGVIAVGAVLGMVISRAMKHWISEQLKELRPNGGGSTYDIVRKLEREARRTADAMDQLCNSNDELLSRVSKLEQVVVAWTPAKKTSTPRGTKKPSSTEK